MRTKHTARKSTGRGAPPRVYEFTPSSTPSKARKRNPSTTSAGGSGGKNRRYKPGTVALREIRKLQKTADLLIPAAPFIRTVKEITSRFSPGINRWQAEALHALQEAAEDFIVKLFEDGMLCAIHAKRVTLMRKDLELARRLGGREKYG